MTPRFLSILSIICILVSPIVLDSLFYDKEKNPYENIPSVIENFISQVIETLVIMGGFSFLSLIFGILSYKKIPNPVPIIRKIEIISIGLLFIIILVANIYVLFSLFIS